MARILTEIVNGLNRPETKAMPVDEFHRLVSQEFGEHSKGIIDAYRRDYPQALRLTYMPHRSGLFSLPGM